MAGFLDWLYHDNAPLPAGDRPWEWCQRGVGSAYHWPSWEFHQRGLLPKTHALAKSAAIWLIDDLGLSPEQVWESASAHTCAFKWKDLPRLREVGPPPRPIASASPKLRLAELEAWAQDHRLPVKESPEAAMDGLELLDLLLCVPSGIDGPHGLERWFPSIAPP